MSLLDKMGYHKVGNPIIATMENANMLSEMLCDEIDSEFATKVIEAAYAEGLDPYAEGMFGTTFNPMGGVRSMARDAKQLVGRGWQFIKDMIKKVIDMIKNILKDFFAAEKQVGKLLNDCKKALNERVRDIRDNNKVMKVITFNSLSELGIPIHEATRGSYSAKLLLMCGLLDKASTQRSNARTQSGESYNIIDEDFDSFGEIRKATNSTYKNGRPNRGTKPKPDSTNNNNNTNSSSSSGTTKASNETFTSEENTSSNGKSEDGENVDTTGQNTGETTTVDQELEDMYNDLKKDISNTTNTDYSNQTQDGKNASEVAPDIKDYRNFILAEVKGGRNMSNRDWADLLNEMAKIINAKSRDYLDVNPGMITYVAREMYSYGLYSKKRIQGNEKERKAQANDMNLQKLKRYRLRTPDVYEATSNLLHDFIDLYTELQKQKLSDYFKNKQNALKTLSSKLDRLQNRVNDNNRDGKQNLNNQRGSTAFVDQGRDNNNNQNQNTNTGNNNANAQSADYIELLNDISKYSTYGEGLFNNTDSNTANNNNSNNNQQNNNSNTNSGNGQNIEQDEDTNNLINYVRAYIVGTSQGLMQAASFYNAILKKWNEACRNTIVAYYAVTTTDKKPEKYEDFKAPNPNGQNEEEIPTGKEQQYNSL